MIDTHAHPGTRVVQQWDPGTPVYDTAGVWIGIVSLHNVPGPYLHVQKGRLFRDSVIDVGTRIKMQAH